VFSLLAFVVVPLLVGYILESYVLVHVLAPLNSMPVVVLWQTWASGILLLSMTYRPIVTSMLPWLVRGVTMAACSRLWTALLNFAGMQGQLTKIEANGFRDFKLTDTLHGQLKLPFVCLVLWLSCLTLYL
jgi:hypothetical protein